ncbi:DNA adenine methylase [Stenotrophomonas maltophilia]|nr:DNA adenine methylase [Stenotrophomonas maltophilia]
MPNVTPLRYPGGKARLFKYFHRLVAQNNLYDYTYVEPFCGGAGIAIELLRASLVDGIHLNDFDRAVYAFWHQAVYNTAVLCDRIEQTPVNMDSWQEAKEIYASSSVSPIADLGFATFFLNRTNRSGILKAGAIGGKRQEGEWKLDARFNKSDLIDRIERIGRLSSRISVTNLDACDLVTGISRSDTSRLLVYLDPPYVQKGPGLYLNAYEASDHRRLSKLVKKLPCKWVVSYDDDPLVRELYDDCVGQDLSLHYSAQAHSRIGRERIYFSEGLLPPSMEGVSSRYRMPWIADQASLARTA